MGALVHFLSKLFFAADRRNITVPADPKSCLIIRQHNQLGDMLATVPLYRAVKSNYPGICVHVLASPDNFFALNKNRYIDNLFVFDKKQLFSLTYLKKFFGFLRKRYDIVLVPGTVSISFTSCLLAGIAKSEMKIGPLKLNGIENKAEYFFHVPVELDWRQSPKESVYGFVLHVLKPLNPAPVDIHGEITFDETDLKEASEFLHKNNSAKSTIVGFHVGAGKPPNVWKAEKFAAVIKLIEKNFGAFVFLTGSSQDEKQINSVIDFLGREIPVFKNRTIMSLAAVISMTNLFITNDTGIMHVAGATDVAQISLFGPTDPDNWAPPGKNKIIIRKSDNIEDISVEDVFATARNFLTGNGT